MVESKFVVFQMIPHTLFIEWDFGHCSLAVVKLLFTYTVMFIYAVLFTYTVLFIRPIFFFKCSFLDLFNIKFYA